MFCSKQCIFRYIQGVYSGMPMPYIQGLVLLQTFVCVCICFVPCVRCCVCVCVCVCFLVRVLDVALPSIISSIFRYIQWYIQGPEWPTNVNPVCLFSRKLHVSSRCYFAKIKRLQIELPVPHQRGWSRRGRQDLPLVRKALRRPPRGF